MSRVTPIEIVILIDGTHRNTFTHLPSKARKLGQTDRTRSFLVIKIRLQGDYIWIEPISGREFDVAIGARVISAEGRRIQVKDDDNKVK